MRLSYSDKLIELDQHRRAKAYGQDTKRRHLKLIAIVSAIMYMVVRVGIWMHPKAVTHAWIDDVLVEVVEDDGMEFLCTIIGSIFIISILLLFFLLALGKCGVRRSTVSHKSSRGPRVTLDGSQRVKSGWTAPFSSIAVPNQTLLGGLPRTAASFTTTTTTTNPITATTVAGTASLTERQQSHQSIRSQAELNEFLSSKEFKENKGAEVAPPTVNITNFPTITNTTTAAASSTLTGAFTGPLVGGAMSSNPSGGIRVQYRGGGGDQRPAAQLVDTEWGALGIINAERSLVKVREWLSGICHGLAEEIAACDRWFAERQISLFDSRHCLQEIIHAPRPPNTISSTISFGAPPAPATAPLRKLDALLNERKYTSGQTQSEQTFDTIQHLNKRLELEEKLDLAGTFPPAVPLSLAEQQTRRQYVIKRLRTFATQKTLASFKHNRGDADIWRDELPTDAHLLIHIVRVCVEGFTNYVKLPHQPMNAHQDLALLVGDTGEPYFYVRYRNGPIDKTYATHQGMNSLFEALLIFAAVVRTYHNASYGGIWGVMDLSRTGLLNVL